MERDEARADIRLKARFMSTVSHDAGDQGKSALVRTRCVMSSWLCSGLIFRVKDAGTVEPLSHHL